MTEIPEHLLARSKARRSAIGDDAGAASGAGAESGGGAAGTAVEKAAPAAAAAAAGPAAAGGIAPSKAPVAPAAPPAKPKRPEVLAAESRKKIPWWAVSALVALPAWAFLYAFTLDPPTVGLSPALSAGQEIYGASCAGCHQAGGVGQGDVFPGFTEGSVILTFPAWEDQVEWVHQGAAAANADGTYGDPARPGGQHSIALFSGVMPGFAESLSEEQILEIVRYEREVLGEYGCEPTLAEATGEVCAPGTEVAEGTPPAAG